MKLRTIFAAAAVTALFAAAPVVAHAGHDGDWDGHHEWHEAPWWYHHHPGWVWHHHREWVAQYPQWRPYYGDWDDHHVWRDRDWWYDHHPDWVREHHHDWVRWHHDDD